MVIVAQNASSRRMERLAKKLEDKEYRDAYLSSHLRSFLAGQIRSLRGDCSQAEFGEYVGKPQSVISRLENAGAGQLSIQTLLDIAQKLDVALVVRFVDFPVFLKFTSDFSNEAVMPVSYTQKEMKLLVKKEQAEAMQSSEVKRMTSETSAEVIDFPSCILTYSFATSKHSTACS